MRRIIVLVLLASSCDCGGTKLLGINNPPPAQQDAGANVTCGLGTVTGRACAPDDHTWIAGAAVDVEGTDCNGQSFHVSSTSKADGTFALNGVPSGKWTVRLRSGPFSTDYDVTVTANATTKIPDNQLCFAQDATHIAVVTGKGDHIETLLTGMGLTVDKTLDGTTTGWSTSAQPFLMDRSQLEQYQVLFIDCAAADNSSHKIDLGDAQTIAGNLKDFVAGGGSVYASDWAAVFLAQAWPAQLPMLTHDSVPVTSPFEPYQFMGYAQTVTAQVADSGLAAALGKSQLTVAFPQGHWGLIENAAGGAKSLLDATVTTCSSTSTRYPLDCNKAGAQAVNIPLALTFAPTADNPSKQGRVTYTSFHNISQPTGDVEALLKYLVFHL